MAGSCSLVAQINGGGVRVSEASHIRCCGLAAAAQMAVPMAGEDMVGGERAHETWRESYAPSLPARSLSCGFHSCCVFWYVKLSLLCSNSRLRSI